ncbi:alpha/beta hydrolase [Mucilaginibacter sp. KACC 22063]|uniref:alpha/beta hydrolase n=1 Tax=Mucilaginibacter sp. KACC 22063 TaxID=3025666 RepID=UPI00236607FE|nr:alpha/beta hydrolase-fold protein [Mucilaginibacter sp. KACC 22063]WDF54574.1 alpha/beta hydrolase-fold protein [Mucilaginibacter sp. KACC 22063]
MPFSKKHFALLLSLFVICTQQLSAQTDTRPIIIGLSEAFYSKVLNETRTINIYLPEGYNPTDTLKYPVIYIPDGGEDEDFIHLTGIIRFDTQAWVNRVPQSIVVGIKNVNRRRDFTFPVNNLDFLEKTGFKKDLFPKYGGSTKYIAFLEKELQPYIAKKYKASTNRTIIGESMAGLLITEIALNHPSLFNTYIIVSPSLWWGGEALLHQPNALLQNKMHKPVNIYIGAPNKKEDEQMYIDAQGLYNMLKADTNIRLFFDYLPDESHATVLHQAAYNAFKMIYSKTGL